MQNTSTTWKYHWRYQHFIHGLTNWNHTVRDYKIFPCESIAEEVSFEGYQYRIPFRDSGVKELGHMSLQRTWKARRHKGINVTLEAFLSYIIIYIPFSHTWRHGGHLGVPNQSCGSWTLFVCKRFILSQSCVPLEWKRSINFNNSVTYLDKVEHYSFGSQSLDQVLDQDRISRHSEVEDWCRSDDVSGFLLHKLLYILTTDSTRCIFHQLSKKRLSRWVNTSLEKRLTRKTMQNNKNSCASVKWVILKKMCTGCDELMTGIFC